MILHISSTEIWENAKRVGLYEANTLTSQGFIHCSKTEQVIKVANSNFKGTSNLVLLLIDEQKVRSEIKYEGGGELYPHIYGPLNIDAVINVVKFPCNKDGNFSLPNLN